jgi:arabinogalactan endo-1,4-beta-galactosidase
VVETAYYSDNWYPEPDEWVLNVRPFPPTENGQYNYLKELAKRLKKYPKVRTVFYWKPDELDIPESKVPFLGRSLFDRNGNALEGITAWKSSN